MSKVVTIYDGYSMKRLAYLENAYNISYEKHTTVLWTGQFSLPYSDPKLKYCQTFNYAEIWDSDSVGRDRYVGLFRIMPRTEETIGTEANVQFQLEHVLGTLLDDVMIGWHEIGNQDTYTNQVIAYILQNQTHQRWVLESCDYEYEFLYGWQDENLLSALFSICEPFIDIDYYWDFNTRVYPWKLRLRRTNPVPVTDIRYKKNLNGLTRIEDPTNLTTRLYCYGYGDGDNKLGISEVNNGLPYLDSPNILKYGIITQIWTDESYTVAESLKATGEAILRKLEEPNVTYVIDIQTIYQAGDLNIGDTVRVVSIGIDKLMTVKKLSKDDVSGEPQAGTIELGEGTIDISDSTAELSDRQRISETYAQGSESIFTDSFMDNADAITPAEVTFTIPENAVHVNEIRFSCKMKNFRAYSKAVKGGGGGDDTTFSVVEQVVTSSEGGSYEKSSDSGGQVSQTSQSGGGVSQSTHSGGYTGKSSDYGGFYANTYEISNVLPDASNPLFLHNHGMLTGVYFLTGLNVYKNAAGTVTDVYGVNTVYSWAASGNHQHYITIPSHTHWFTVDAHTHWMMIDPHTHYISIAAHSHMIRIPTHTHTLRIPSHNHKYTLPNHTHDLEYGIYKGPMASSMKIYLDETLVGTYSNDISDVNLISYMSKNANGKILRGTHVIRIEPNALTRIECTFQIRLFTNARGGGQY